MNTPVIFENRTDMPHTSVTAKTTGFRSFAVIAMSSSSAEWSSGNAPLSDPARDGGAKHPRISGFNLRTRCVCTSERMICLPRLLAKAENLFPPLIECIAEGQVEKRLLDALPPQQAADLYALVPNDLGNGVFLEFPREHLCT